MLLTTFALIVVSSCVGNVFGAVSSINENKVSISNGEDRSLWNTLFSPSIGAYHGYVSNPPSRASLCQLRVNKNCGQIMYEPQSVEGSKGFPFGSRSPADGKIASGGNSVFRKLDEYGKNRWNTVEFPEVRCFNETHLYFNLIWTITAPHSTDSIRVFASNENYSPDEPLSRRHLDLDPICSYKFYGKYPPTQFTLNCPISKEKYQRLYRSNDLLLLSVWDIKDTGNAFYQVVDLEISPENKSYENIRNKC